MLRTQYYIRLKKINIFYHLYRSASLRGMLKMHQDIFGRDT